MCIFIGAQDYITNMSEADIEWAERLCETQTVTVVEEHDDYLNT